MSSQTMLYASIKDVRPVPTSSGKNVQFSSHSPLKNEISLKGYLVRYLSEGKEKFRLDGRTYYLSAGEYIILNPGEIIHFVEENSKGLWAEVPKSFIQREYSLLSAELTENWDVFVTNEKKQLTLCDHVYLASMDGLGRLLSSWSEMESIPDNGLQILSHALLNSQREVYARIGKLTSAKLSTRTELYRRLCQAQAYIHGNLDSPLDLDTLSQVACLSKYHFIRLFKEVYGETPRQYLIKQRLDKAKSLLVSSKKTFHEICHEVGLKDSSSFGRLFKRSFGATPQIYRQTHALG